MTSLINNNETHVDNIATAFRIELNKVSFVDDGMFLLKLTVNSSNSTDKRGLRLRSKNSEKFIRDFSVRTEILNQVTKPNVFDFKDGEYSFYLNKGFCKNVIDHNVYLLVEALQIEHDNKTKVIGSAKIPIHPRSDVPVNYNVEMGDPFYKFRGSIDLIKFDSATPNSKCATLFYYSELSEIREIIEISENETVPQSQSENVKQSKKTSKKIIEMSSFPIDDLNKKDKKSKKTKTPKISHDIGPIIEFGASPIPFEESLLSNEPIYPPRDINIRTNTYNLLSPKNMEEISVIVQGGEHLFGENQKPVRTYVTGSIKIHGSRNKSKYDSTHATQVQTSFPNWEEILNLPYPVLKTRTVLLLTVIDFDAKEKIVEYVLPINYSLIPFQQYHLKLCQKITKGYTSQTLFVTIIRKLDHYPLTGKSTKPSAFIVKPLEFYYPRDDSDKIPIICFCYLSNDPTKHKKKIFSIEENVVTIQLPVTSEFTYSNKQIQSMSSFGQLSIPAIMSNEIDTFNFPFLFCQMSELDTSFASNSFIVLDFYEATPNNSIYWRYHSPVMRTILPLDTSLYQLIRSQKPAYINAYNIHLNEPFDNEEVIKFKKTKDNVDQKIFVKLWILNEDISDSISPERLTRKEIIIPQNEISIFEPIPSVKQNTKNESFLYDINPVNDSYIFDDYAIQNSLPTETASDEMIKRFLQDGVQNEDSKVKSKPKLNKSGDPFKQGYENMQQEIITLRNQISRLVKENKNLEADSLFKSRPRNPMIKPNRMKHLESLSTEALFKEYDELRRKFSSQVSIMSDYKNKEKHLTKSLYTSNVENTPLNLIHNLQQKSKYINKLEKDVKEKENVIQRLEKKLDGKYQPLPIITENVFNSDTHDEEERNQLYEKLQNAENRIETLHHEMMEIARQRGANRQMMKIKAKEKLYR